MVDYCGGVLEQEFTDLENMINVPGNARSGRRERSE